MLRPRLLAALAALPVVLAALPAHAGEDESALSVGAGYASYVIPDGEDGSLASTAGLQLSVQYERGFAEAYSVRVSGALAGYVGGGTSWTGQLAGGVVYRFDVLKYVPYAFAVIGGMVGGSGRLDGDLDGDGGADCDTGLADCGGGFEPLIGVGGGLDILRSRETSWGFEVQASAFVGDTALLSAGVRYTRRWGFF